MTQSWVSPDPIPMPLDPEERLEILVERLLYLARAWGEFRFRPVILEGEGMRGMGTHDERRAALVIAVSRGVLTRMSGEAHREWDERYYASHPPDGTGLHRTDGFIP